MEISVKKLSEANVYELSKLAFLLNRQSVQEEFAKIGIYINDGSELKWLAELHRTGGDTSGELKDIKGNPIFFDFEQVLGNVNIDGSHKEMVKDINLNWE